jgi:vacuolar-type H+-ATPase subunit H
MTTQNDDLKTAKQTLTELRDELKLKLNLGAMEAGDRAGELWKDVEKAMQKVDGVLDRVGDQGADVKEKARYEATLALNSLKSSWAGFEKTMGSLVDEAKEKGSQLKSDADGARLQAHLAAMNAEGAVDDKLEDLGDKFEAHAEKAIADVKASLTSLKARLFG